MLKIVQKLSLSAVSLLLTAMTLYSSAVSAAGLTGADTLPDSPLFLQSSVQPNILLLVDDSGSMSFETMIEGTNNGIYFTPHGDLLFGSATGPQGYGYTHFTSDQRHNRATVPSEQFFINDGSADAKSELALIWRIWNSDYNKMYYDPKTRYTHWVGNDSTGTPYGDAPVGDVTINTGTFPSHWKGDRDNIPGFWTARYYKWDDKDSDGLVDDLYDATDRATNLVEITDPGTYEGGPDRTDCANPLLCTYNEEIQNFANWFAYYRKRDFVMKSAFSAVLSINQNRVGLATINDNNSVAIPIRDLTDTSDNPTNREKLLTNLFKIDPDGGTPLRVALREAGEYYQSGDNIMSGVSGGSVSPILASGSGGECQQNYSLLVTDGFWNRNSPGVGNTDGPGSGNTAYDGGSHADSVSDTLADVAMKFYETDLKPGLADKVSPNGDDNNPAQHMVTYGVAFGVNGDIQSNPTDRTTAFAWPNPVDPDTKETIDDLRHAAWNGRGEFVNAESPEELIANLSNAFESIDDRVGSGGSATFNTPVLSDGSKAYFSEFNSMNWKGDLKAFDLDDDTGAVLSPQIWSAADELDAVDPENRVMLTYKNGAGGIKFRWTDLTAAQKDDLKNGGSDSEGEDRYEYIRGFRSLEQTQGGTFRNRLSIMGDLVHSAPAFVGKHPDTWQEDAYSGYDSFVTGFVNTPRTPVVYVGGNDGALHGFRVDNGKEVLAYIPGSVYSATSTEGLHYLTDPNYKHRNYVDLTPVVSDAKVGANWKTMLVGGLRGGGRGYFALDVTNPANFTEANAGGANGIVKWEFTNADDADLGYSYSTPSIVPVEGNEWVVIFGNGYKSDNGQAALFMLKLGHDASSGWSGDYYKITVGSSGSGNGLSTPVVVDKDGNGLADLIYAGDLKGNMWAFDIPASGPASATARPAPLFTDPAGNAITSSPAVVRHPQVQSSGPDMLLMFGTGRFLVDADPANTDVQTFYGIWDNGSPVADLTELVPQTISTETTTSGHTARVLSRQDVPYPAKRGWYFNLSDVAGERVVLDPLVRGFDVLLVTSIPSTAPCDNAGSGFLMSADILTGGSPRTESLDINGDGEVNAGDLFIDTDGDGLADLAADSLLTTAQDLDGDGVDDTVTDLDGDGVTDFADLTILLHSLNLTVDTFGSAGLSIEDVGLTGGFSMLSNTAYVIGTQNTGPSTGAGSAQGIKLVPVPDELLNRLSWEEL